MIKSKHVIYSSEALLADDTSDTLGFNVSSTNHIAYLNVSGAGDATKEITQIITRADDTADLDGTYFILQDEVGSVAFWFDVDNSGTTIPAGASAADRAIEITTIVTDDDIATVGTAVYTAIIADSKFEAGSDDLAGTILVQSSTTGVRDAADNGDSGFVTSEDTRGSLQTTTDVVIQHSADGTNWLTLKTFTQILGATGTEALMFDNTDEHILPFVRATVDLGIELRATVTCEIHYDLL